MLATLLNAPDIDETVIQAAMERLRVAIELHGSDAQQLIVRTKTNYLFMNLIVVFNNTDVNAHPEHHRIKCITCFSLS